MHHEECMRLAIEEARNSGTPYGAVIAMGDDILASAGYRVSDKSDPTAHPVITVIREVSAMTRQTTLPGYSVYCTLEPCQMCASALLWSRIGEIYIGLSASDKGFPVRHSRLDRHTLLTHSSPMIMIQRGLLEDECRKLVEEFSPPAE